MENLFKRLDGVFSWFNLLFTGEKYERWLVAFLGMVDSLTEKEVEELLKRLSLPEKFREGFLQRRRMAIQVVLRLAHSASMKRSDLYFLLHPLPPDFLLYAMGKTETEDVKKAISLYFTGLKRTRVSLSGKDLRRMGYKPGPIYAEILQSLLRARLDGKLQNHQDEVEYVLHRFNRQAEFVQRRGGGQRLLPA